MMTEEDRMNIGCMWLAAFVVGVIAGSVALGMYVGAWAGFALFAICSLAFGAVCVLAIGRDREDGNDE